MLSALNKRQKGIFLAVIGFSAFAVSDACAKWLTGSYAEMTVIGYTYLFSFIVCLLSAPYTGGISCTLKSNKMKYHTGRAICNVFLAYFVVQAFKHLPLATVYTVLFLSPFVITILAIPFYKERVSMRNWFVIALGFSGILVAFQPGFAVIDPWIISAFLTVIFIAGMGLMARPLDEHETVLSLAFYPNLLSVIVFLPPAYASGDLPSLLHLPVFVLAGVMLTTGLICIASAFRIAPYSVVSPFNYLQMIWALIFGYLIFNEVPDAAMLVGAAMIIGSGLYLIYAEKTASKSETPLEDLP